MRRRLSDKNGRLSVRPSDVEVVVVSSTVSFRRLAGELPNPDDAVLEIGCSTGGATRLLAATGARVVAVDKSAELVGQLHADMAQYDNVTVARADARNIPELAALLPDPTVILIDVGGKARLDNVALHLRLCLRAFSPRLVLVRSFELATLAALISEIEPPRASGLCLPDGAAVGRDRLSNLLDLSAASSADSRVFAAQQLRRYDSPDTRRRLEEMLADPHRRVRRAAQRALDRLRAGDLEDGV